IGRIAAATNGASSTWPLPRPSAARPVGAATAAPADTIHSPQPQPQPARRIFAASSTSPTPRTSRPPSYATCASGTPSRTDSRGGPGPSSVPRALSGATRGRRGDGFATGTRAIAGASGVASRAQAVRGSGSRARSAQGARGDESPTPTTPAAARALLSPSVD